MKSEIQFLRKYKNADIYIKRDDLLPFSLGGNKVRIADEFFRDMEEKNCDLIISYGSPASNLNRVIAHMAQEREIPCVIICKNEEEDASGSGKHFNEILTEKTNAVIRRCERQKVKETVESVIDEAKRDGRNPYYVYGDSSGTGNEAVALRAYEKAAAEIKAYEEREGFVFDEIFTATGTGMTQAGLISGKIKSGLCAKITGISVARNSEYGKKTVFDALFSAGLKPDVESGINLTDGYLKGGYGKYDEEIAFAVDEMISKYGIALDPCYSGKAFFGMLEELSKDESGERKNVLFIHTGGLSGFFDYLEKDKGWKR